MSMLGRRLPVLEVADPSTFDEALCLEVGPEPFYADGDDAEYAATVCARCPLATRDACRDLARTIDRAYGYHGVWGGMTKEQRKAEDEGRPVRTSNKGPDYGPCPSCGKTLARVTLRLHATKGCPASHARAAAKASKPPKLPCPRCGRLLAPPSLLRHTSAAECPTRPKARFTERGPCPRCGRVLGPQQLVTHARQPECPVARANGGGRPRKRADRIAELDAIVANLTA